MSKSILVLGNNSSNAVAIGFMLVLPLLIPKIPTIATATRA